MLKLSTDDRKQLRLALMSGFRQYSSLKMFVSDNFDEPRLEEIAGSAGGTIVAADNLINDFDQRGDVSALILALYKERPRNPEVQYLVGRLQGFLRQQLVLDPTELDLTEIDTLDFSFELPEPARPAEASKPRADLAIHQAGVIPTEALPVWIGDPSMLKDPLELMQALRPLLAQVAAGTGQ